MKLIYNEKFMKLFLSNYDKGVSFEWWIWIAKRPNAWRKMKSQNTFEIDIFVSIGIKWKQIKSMGFVAKDVLDSRWLRASNLKLINN